MTKQERIEYVLRYWANIGNIKRPNKTLQLAAVRQYAQAIKWIKNPDKDVQLVAVKTHMYAINWIKNPDPSVIRYLKIREKLDKL